MGAFKGAQVRDIVKYRDLLVLFEQVPGIQFWIKDAEGRFQACNRAFAAHFGLSRPEDLQGRTDFDVSPQHLAREYVADDSAVMKSGKPLQEKLELVRERDGSTHWYATSKVPLRDPGGAIQGTAGFTRRVQDVEGDSTPGRGMERAVAQMQTRYGEDLSIASLARTAGMSVDRFERRFRAAFRETPLRHLNRIRMRAACQLLIHTELTVGEIARKCGFSDQSYFAKRFFANFRIRPLEYRRKFGRREGASA